MGKRVVEISATSGGRYGRHLPEGLVELMKELTVSRITVGEVNCKGKFMWWCLTPEWTLWCTYGMSGQWNTTKGEHCAAEVRYTDEEKFSLAKPAVYFNDPRHFGTLKFVHDPEGVHTQKKLDALGPDMLSDPPSTFEFGMRLNRRKDKTIVEALMDQSVVSGVGNYIKAESLYLAEISPHRIVSTLTSMECDRLRQQIINVMKASYNTGGATFSTYRNPDGSSGHAQRRFVVYGNRTDPMGNSIIKEATLDGRTTHWCPAVQR